MGRNKFIASDQWCIFQKNVRKPYILGVASTGAFRLLKMMDFCDDPDLGTYTGQILQVFKWRDLEDNILGNQL